MYTCTTFAEIFGTTQGASFVASQAYSKGDEVFCGLLLKDTEVSRLEAEFENTAIEYRRFEGCII